MIDRLTSPLIMFMGIAGLFIYLYFTGGLSQNMFYLLGFMIIMLMFLIVKGENLIGYDDARRIGKAKIEELQKKGEIESGTVYLMPETGLKYDVFETENPEIRESHFDVGVIVEGSSTRGYLVRISVRGNIIMTSEIDLPSSYRVHKIKDIRIIKSAPKSGEYEQKMSEQKKEKKVEEE